MLATLATYSLLFSAFATHSFKVIVNVHDQETAKSEVENKVVEYSLKYKKTDLTLKEEPRSGHVSASKNKLYNTLVYHDHSITN